MISLDVTKRTKADTVPALMRAGKIPAVFYGKKEASTPIAISLVDFKKVFKQAGESMVITLQGEGVEVEALVHDIDFDPVTDTPRHVDFYAFEKGKKVQIGVPIEFIGVSEAIKSLGGTLVKVLHELEVEALPKDLPRDLHVDIAPLIAMDSVILAKDVTLPAGVELITKGDDIVASVAEPMKEEEVAVPMDITDIEVEKKGKDEEAAADGEAAPEKKEEKKEEKK